MVPKRKSNIYLPAIITGITLLCGAGLLHAEEAPGAGPLVDVHVASIQRSTLHRYLMFYGRVAPEPSSEKHRAASSRVAAIVAGQIVAVPAVEGGTVHRNDVLVRLDSREADAALGRAKAALKQAKAAFSRQQTLAKTDDTSSKKYELAEKQLAEATAALKEAETGRALLDIKAPLNGTVLQVNVRPGEAVAAGTVVAEIQDLDRLVAEVQIPTSQLDQVHLGQLATVQSSGKDTLGEIGFVGKRIDPATGTAVARIALPGGAGLYPGQFVRASVAVEQRAGMVVPVNAVFHRPDGTGVVAVVTGDRVVHRPVRLGIEDNGRVGISGDGISVGQQVVTTEMYGLPDNTRVHIIQP